jgi:leucyl aminopeptidase
MSISCLTSTQRTVKADAVVIFMLQDAKAFAAESKSLKADIPHLQPLLDSGDFEAKKLQSVTGYVGSAASSPRFILVGIGTAEELNLERIRRAAATATKRAAALGCIHVAYELPELSGYEGQHVAKAITEGAMLSQYGFVKYKTEGDDKFVTKFTMFTTTVHIKAAKKGVAEASAIVAGVLEARDLANAPNCEIYPQTLGRRAAALGRKFGFKTSVLNKKQIEELKMGGLLGVNQGSVRPPVFIVMEYNGGSKGEKPVVLVGKGVTFDTGGISLKPSPGMSEMKSDMHGAASVIGTMIAIAGLGLKRNVVALVPATENMPSGSALLPGDIVKFMNGKTAEIDNTDAEGRLILADALCYAARYKPEAVIDLATLTGAIVVALGNVTTGMMGTDADTMKRLGAAASATNEYVCELPLYEEYEELISSDYADVKNSGGRAAGSITAALFLKKFVSFPWVHLDIAGTGISPRQFHYVSKGGTGVGVRLLTEALQNW